MSDNIPRRDSNADYIGRQGHRQVEGWLDEHGFLPSRIDPDRGEDILVRVYREGRASGLNCYIQVKSTDDLSKYRLTNGTISYPIETKDLRHWCSSMVPIFLIVWDTTQQTGRWLEISRALLSRIDDDTPKWLEQKTLQLRLPPENQTDAAGIQKMRLCLLEHYRPIWEKETITAEVSFEFPDTPEGQRVQANMERWRNCGDAVEVPLKYLKRFHVSENAERWFGQPTWGEQGSIRLHQQPSKEEIRFQLRCLSSTGRQRAQTIVALRFIKHGEIEMTLSNAHHPSPFLCEFVVRKERGGTGFALNITTRGIQARPQEVRQALPFFTALAESGTIQISALDLENWGPLTAQVDKDEFDDFGDEFADLIDKLCTIEAKTGANFTLSQYELSRDDWRDIFELYEIVTSGLTTDNGSQIKLTMRGPKDPKANLEIVEALLKETDPPTPFKFDVSQKKAGYEILGQQIDMGEMHQHWEGNLSPSTLNYLRQLRRKPQQLRLLESLSLVVDNFRVVFEYPNWGPDTPLALPDK